MDAIHPMFVVLWFDIVWSHKPEASAAIPGPATGVEANLSTFKSTQVAANTAFVVIGRPDGDQLEMVLARPYPRSRWPSIHIYVFILYLFYKFYGTFAQFEPQSIAQHFPQLGQVSNQ